MLTEKYIILLTLSDSPQFDQLLFSVLMNYINLTRSFPFLIYKCFEFLLSYIKHATYILFLHLDSTPKVSIDLSALWILSLLLTLSGDIHPNPGPIPGDFSSGFLSFCNWNLNSLAANNFNRLTLLNAENTIHKYDIISLCETSLNDDITVPPDAIPGYTFHPLNHPSGGRHGGVGIFYKESLPLRIREDLSFDECLVSEIKFGRKKIFFTVFYRNPENKASSPEFQNFKSNFQNLYEKIK